MLDVGTTAMGSYSSTVIGSKDKWVFLIKDQGGGSIDEKLLRGNIKNKGDYC